MSFNRFSSAGYKEEKVANLLRSVVQDGCKQFEEKSLIHIYKEVDEEGKKRLYGDVARDYARLIIGSLQANTEIQRKLLLLAWLLYEKGENLNESRIWRLAWINYACPLFSKKFADLPSTGSVASMDSWDKPEHLKKKDEWEDW